MRRLALWLGGLAAFLLCALPAGAVGFTFVSAQGANATSSSSLATANWSATAGDTTACVISMFGQTVNAVTDTNTTALTVQTTVNTGGGGHLYIAYLLSVASSTASYHVTVTTTGGPNELSIACAGFTKPASTTVSLDQTNTATGGPSAPTVSVTSVTAASLIVGGTSFDSTTVETAGSGYTVPTNGLQPSNGDATTHQPCALEYNLNATGGTTTVAFGTSTSGWAIRGTSLKVVATAINLPQVFVIRP